MELAKDAICRRSASGRLEKSWQLRRLPIRPVSLSSAADVDGGIGRHPDTGRRAVSREKKAATGGRTYFFLGILSRILATLTQVMDFAREPATVAVTAM